MHFLCQFFVQQYESFSPFYTRSKITRFPLQSMAPIHMQLIKNILNKNIIIGTLWSFWMARFSAGCTYTSQFDWKARKRAHAFIRYDRHVDINDL